MYITFDISIHHRLPIAMLNPTDDLTTIADGLETVTLLRRGSASGEGTIIAHALRRAMTAFEASIATSADVHKQVPSGGRNTAADVVWHLPAAELAEAPRLGDWIVDADAQRWTILEVKLASLGARWRCETRNVAVACGLDDTIGVLKASYVKSACGAAEPVWRTWKTGIRARIQPIDTKLAADETSRAAIARYRIFVEEELDLDQTCCIRGPDGTIFQITGVSGAQRIGELQVIQVEVKR
jgi:hypothetical protein